MKMLVPEDVHSFIVFCVLMFLLGMGAGASLCVGGGEKAVEDAYREAEERGYMVRTTEGYVWRSDIEKVLREKE